MKFIRSKFEVIKESGVWPCPVNIDKFKYIFLGYDPDEMPYFIVFTNENKPRDPGNCSDGTFWHYETQEERDAEFEWIMKQVGAVKPEGEE